MKRVLRFAVLAAVVAFTAGCEGGLLFLGSDHGEPVVFEIDQSGERFHIAVTDADLIDRLEVLRKSGDPASVISGTLRSGNGGFNAPYDWHLDPASVVIPDVAMELCDGRPSFVQQELAYWLDTVKQYCPWGPRVVGRK